jgi:hypothetical protein
MRGAGLQFAGRTTQRMVVSDIDVRETEAMMIIYALTPALAVGREYDPFFDTSSRTYMTRWSFPILARLLVLKRVRRLPTAEFVV